MDFALSSVLIWLISAICANYLADGLEIQEILIVAVFAVLFWFTLLFPDRRSNFIDMLLIFCACSILGMIFGIALSCSTRFKVYAAFMSYFHLSEFGYITYSSKRPSFESFLINHGREYAIAFTASMIEYWLSPWHPQGILLTFGIAVSISGLLVRGLAILTAGSGFTHLIAKHKSTDHALVMYGPYQYMRHPGYCGWFIWVIGSQLLLNNPICLVLFSVVTWRFFQDRIPYEEELLIKFFGDEYLQYKRRVPCTGVLFIR